MADWIITKNHLDSGPSMITSAGVGSLNDARLAEIRRDWYAFRLYDDDDELYYSGYCSDCETEAAFAPLDDFGMPDSGCTRIDYKNPKTGKWETL